MFRPDIKCVEFINQQHRVQGRWNILGGFQKKKWRPLNVRIGWRRPWYSLPSDDDHLQAESSRRCRTGPTQNPETNKKKKKKGCGQHAQLRTTVDAAYRFDGAAAPVAASALLHRLSHLIGTRATLMINKAIGPDCNLPERWHHTNRPMNFSKTQLPQSNQLIATEEDGH